jgi:hypothetical protein
VQAARGANWVDVFPLYDPVLLRHQGFEDLFMLRVARKETFVSEQDDGFSKVRIEPTDKVLRLHDGDEVRAEQLAVVLRKDAFADPHVAAQNERRAAWLVGVLHAIRHPPDDVVVQLLVASADVFADVREVERTLGLAIDRVGRDCEAPPEIVRVGNLSSGREHDLLALPTLRMFKPPLGQGYVLLIAINPDQLFPITVAIF